MDTHYTYSKESKLMPSLSCAVTLRSAKARWNIWGRLGFVPTKFCSKQFWRQSWQFKQFCSFIFMILIDLKVISPTNFIIVLPGLQAPRMLRHRKFNSCSLQELDREFQESSRRIEAARFEGCGGCRAWRPLRLLPPLASQSSH